VTDGEHVYDHLSEIEADYPRVEDPTSDREYLNYSNPHLIKVKHNVSGELRLLPMRRTVHKHEQPGDEEVTFKIEPPGGRRKRLLTGYAKPDPENPGIFRIHPGSEEKFARMDYERLRTGPFSNPRYDWKAEVVSPVDRIKDTARRQNLSASYPRRF
jgi:hypothetical protein